MTTHPARHPAAADERDRVADERDRLANDRDQTAFVRALLLDDREHAADERDRIANDREHAADARDRIADEREHAADERDRIADEREHAAHEREGIAEHELAALRIAMESRAVIEQAKGMVMLTLKIDADAAFDVLVQRSQKTHTKLHETAHQIVDAGMRKVL